MLCSGEGRREASFDEESSSRGGVWARDAARKAATWEGDCCLDWLVWLKDF